METKICKICLISKSLDKFHNNKKGIQGKQPYCKICTKEKTKVYYLNNLEKQRSYAKEYSEKNKNLLIEKRKLIKYNRTKWKKANKDYHIKYFKQRRQTDELFKFTGNVRGLITSTYKRFLSGKFKKSQKTEEIIGCSFQDLLIYISELFTEGMTIQNHGLRHIDHIIPISSAKNKEEIIKLNHYTNLQPLWALDNLLKGNKTII